MQIKGLIGWAVWIGLAGVLVIGAVFRMRSTTHEANSSAGEQRGNGRVRAEAAPQALNPGEGSVVGEPGTREAAWITWEGQVTAVTERMLVLAFSEEPEIRVSGRAWRYALEQGFSAQVGDQLRVSVFYPVQDQVEIGILENVRQGVWVQLRDQTGRASWSAGYDPAGESVSP